jgi:hypothetical protein
MYCRKVTSFKIMNDNYFSNVTRGNPIISEKRSRLYVVTPGPWQICQRVWGNGVLTSCYAKGLKSKGKPVKNLKITIKI